MTLERLYFAYGSNMSSARLRDRIPDAQSIGRAHWPGMRLAFNKVGVDGSGKANLVADPGSVAWGVLFKIPGDAWAILDAFEVTAYRMDDPMPAERLQAFAKTNGIGPIPARDG